MILDKSKFPEDIRTRFAPSPTGYLHLGHVLNAVFVWGIAGALEGEVVVRIEDHDRGRYRKEYEDAIIDDLKWLGFNFAEYSVQRDRFKRYEEFVEKSDEVYFCECTRKIIAEYQTKNHNELWYRGDCRDKNISRNDSGLRMKISGEEVCFDDILLGKQCQVPSHQCGDVILKNRNGEWSYQMAVVCDDIDQNINLIIRGEDILDSTGRQIMLHQTFQNTVLPVFLHHPLLLEKDGKRKMSKRQKSESIRNERERNISAETIIGKACFKGNLIKSQRPVSAEELPYLFKKLIK